MKAYGQITPVIMFRLLVMAQKTLGPCSLLCSPRFTFQEIAPPTQHPTNCTRSFAVPECTSAL